MPDQAQGLRALADRTRRNQRGPSDIIGSNRSDTELFHDEVRVVPPDGVPPLDSISEIRTNTVFADTDAVAVVSDARCSAGTRPVPSTAHGRRHARVIAVTS